MRIVDNSKSYKQLTKLRMENIKQIISFLKVQPLWVKIVAIVVSALVSAVLLFTSCSAQMYQRLPDISDNKIGAEGVVSKEHRTTRETKWYFKPESQIDNTDY